ncbi:hypothetical protein ACGF5F_33885 [Streptomyces sp. NPDC047821]|uniref:hypothetical protein n=1 Tax=unclassified Streptomyces TaxID=2593676 RepID=UPI00363C94DE
MRIATKLTAATGAVLMAGAVMAAPAAAGQDGAVARCPASFSPSTTGGEAAWTVQCVGDKVVIDGWVKDTKADGKCAFVKAFAGFTDGQSRKEAKACPKDTRTKFAWEARGTEVNAFLYVA